jgi:hypothetical protein
MDNPVSVSKLKLLTGISFVAILIPILLWVLWNYCFMSQNTQADSVKMYNSFFPEFLNGRYTISFISAGLCVLGIILSLIHFNKRKALLMSINIFILVIGILMMLLTLFSLM